MQVTTMAEIGSVEQKKRQTNVFNGAMARNKTKNLTGNNKLHHMCALNKSQISF